MRGRRKGLLLYIGAVALSLLGLVGMAWYIHRIRVYPGQSMPGRELLGAFVLSPAVMIAGLVMAGRVRQRSHFVTGTAPRETILRRLTAALGLSVLVSAGLIAWLRSAFSVVAAAFLIAAAVCALIRAKREAAFLKTCYWISLAAAVLVVVLLSSLPAAPGGTLLVVNGFRTYMSHRSGSILGILLILAAGPLLLAWPLALFARGLYEICTWELG